MGRIKKLRVDVKVVVPDVSGKRTLNKDVICCLVSMTSTTVIFVWSFGDRAFVPRWQSIRQKPVVCVEILSLVERFVGGRPNVFPRKSMTNCSIPEIFAFDDRFCPFIFEEHVIDKMSCRRFDAKEFMFVGTKKIEEFMKVKRNIDLEITNHRICIVNFWDGWRGEKHPVVVSSENFISKIKAR